MSAEESQGEKSDDSIDTGEMLSVRIWSNAGWSSIEQLRAVLDEEFYFASPRWRVVESDRIRKSIRLELKGNLEVAFSVSPKEAARLGCDLLAASGLQGGNAGEPELESDDLQEHR